MSGEKPESGVAALSDIISKKWDGEVGFFLTPHAFANNQFNIVFFFCLKVHFFFHPTHVLQSVGVQPSQNEMFV